MSRRWIRAVLVVGGLLSIGSAFALLYGVRDATLVFWGLSIDIEAGLSRIEAIRPVHWGVAIAVSSVGYAAIKYLANRYGRADRNAIEPFPETAPELATESDGSVVGASFTERATAGDVDGLDAELSDLAVRVLCTQNQIDEHQAKQALENGTWTDDIRAAAFLGGSDAPTPSLVIRFRDWFATEPTATRYVRHAVAAIERHHGRRRPSGGVTDE